MSDMRVGGLASGMDTDQIIKDLMKAEKLPLDKMEQKKTYTEWQRDDYREINKELFDFSNSIFDGVMKQSTYTQKTVNVSDPNAVSVKNISSASDFTGSIKVNRLATAATMFGSGQITDPDEPEKPASPSAKLSDLFGITEDQSITIKAVNKEGILEGKTLTLTEDMTLQGMINKINSKTGVAMFYDPHEKVMSVTAKNTGSNENGPEIEFSEGFLTTHLKLDTTNVIAAAADADGNAETEGKRGSLGENASFMYNGLTTERASNTFQINGFELSLKEANRDKTITFSSAPDTDKVLEKIVKFVDDYNKLIEKVNGEIGEKKFRDFQPLSAEQKEAMEEKEIELWEEKARSGTLRNDSVLSSAMNKMRTDLYTPISGGTSETNQLAQIGIKTSSNYLDRGKLIIDENKLKEAISKDPNAIYELFAKNGEATGEKGIARRLRDTIGSTMDSIEQKAGKLTSTNSTFTLGRNLDSINNQMSRFQDRLGQIEDRYWRQFTAMEKAIQQANSQSSYLMQQFSM
ncbi:flagellar hook-associated protein 2 [Rossellomorea vietnamensis]|uniref:Flagellar hook-associated protein 2 n=1 Tax=Rossellomorea vietnamensis TaxID=218284 RepID=A0A5D4NMN6_9BACI|nr:flagellar hook-associated protein 2 [Rossellomorea vietnamensis]TYS15180.1 flagellar hook-associated protein 2 [Rossellomorea vietnamensis]